MLDRMSLSIKNQWFDEKNRAYIYFSIEDIMELLNCGRNKAIKSMRELDDETVIFMLLVIGKNEDCVGSIGGIICGVQLIPLIGSILPTEIALKKNFDKNGTRR